MDGWLHKLLPIMHRYLLPPDRCMQGSSPLISLSLDRMIVSHITDSSPHPVFWHIRRTDIRTRFSQSAEVAIFRIPDMPHSLLINKYNMQIHMLRFRDYHSYHQSLLDQILFWCDHKYASICTLCNTLCLNTFDILSSCERPHKSCEDAA